MRQPTPRLPSEGMDPATITSSTFILTKQGASQPLTAQVSYDAATKKATLDPTADLEASSTYTATIKGGSGGRRPGRQPARSRQDVVVYYGSTTARLADGTT